MNGIAWILATHSDSYGPTGNVAVGLAERAAELTQYRELEILDTLAATYAAAGRFERATTTAQAALSLASAAKLDRRANEIRRRLKLYKQGKPIENLSSLCGSKREFCSRFGDGLRARSASEGQPHDDPRWRFGLPCQRWGHS